MTRNPIAKAVTRIRPQVLPDKREKLLQKTVRVEIRGGCLADVSNLPPGWDYELIDHDNAEEAACTCADRSWYGPYHDTQCPSRANPEDPGEEARAP